MLPRRALLLMPPLISLISVAMLVLPAPAQAWEWSTSGAGTGLVGSGKMVDEARAVAAFNRIRIDGPVNLRASQATSPSVSVHADDNLASQVLTEVDGDTLVIKSRPGSTMRSRQPLVVSVGFAQLAGVEMRGSGDLSVHSLKGTRFELQLSGSGDAKLVDLALESLVVKLAGSGDVTAQGRCDEAQLSIAGSGDLRFAELVSQRASVSIAGSGDARVHATQALTVSIAGSGDVSYSGNPGSVKSKVLGSGSVHALH